MTIEYPKPTLEGYSVARDDTRYGTVYRVYRNNIYVAAISSLGEAFKDRLAFEWHDRFMYSYSVEDFIVAQHSV